MAANNGGKSDRDLLDRLNALKRGPVSQDAAPKVNAPRPPVIRSLPLADTRQDVLSDRLRALRNQPLDDNSSPAASRASGGTAKGLEGKQPSSSTAATSLPLISAPDVGTELGEEDDADGFMSDLGDDGTLEDYLEDLELDLDEGKDDEVEGVHQRPPLEPADVKNNAEDDAKRIAAVMARIGKDGPTLPPGQITGKRTDVKGFDAEGSRAGGDSDDEERHKAEAENIVSRAFDEVQLEREISTAQDENSEDRPLSSHQNFSTSHEEDAREPDDDQSRPLDNAPTGAKDPLSLPAVPDSLPGPSTTTTATPSTGNDFESDISRRLAALRGLGGSGSGGLALPSVPSFQPASNKPAGESKVKSTVGYTDEDQKGWCIVCLADATSICVDCDDDAYCDACWKDMHVGPVAAFDASHKRMAFVKERKKKRMLVAA